MLPNTKIASRYWSASVPVFYVESVKPRGRGDWGYTTDRAKATRLSTYWCKRFAKDCRQVGIVATFTD